MTNPVDGKPFTTADVDRILVLADQFLENWEHGAKDEYGAARVAERRLEWNALRPLLVQVPALLELRAAVDVFLKAEAADGQSYAQIIAPLIAAFDKTEEP